MSEESNTPSHPLGKMLDLYSDWEKRTLVRQNLWALNDDESVDWLINCMGDFNPAEHYEDQEEIWEARRNVIARLQGHRWGVET